ECSTDWMPSHRQAAFNSAQNGMRAGFRTRECVRRHCTFSCNDHNQYRRTRGLPPVPGSSGGPLDPVPPLQVTDWLQSRRQEAMSKMDKFLADVSHKRACIFMTCSRPVTLTFSVMQYLVPRRAT